VISTGGESDTAPTVGEGVFLIPGGIERTVAIAGNVLVIYGTVGATVAVTLWLRPQNPESAATHPYAADSPNGPQRIAASATTEVLAAANGARRGLTVYNESNAVLYLALAPVATLTVYTIQVNPGAYYELPVPVYRGIVSGIWSAANGAALVTELQ
jgi:hypothetical protein